MKKIESLTSLRFFAAACIVLGHGGSRFHYNFELFDLRNGVTFFFVLSGFILSYTYSNFDWNNNFRHYVSARIARVLPACLFTTIAAIFLVAPIKNWIDIFRLLVNVFLLQAWIPISSWHYSFNSVVWSISTEMFFYVIFPLALLLLSRTSVFMFCIFIPAATMLVIASFLDLSIIEGGVNVTAWGIIYINPITRLTEFLAGMLAYRFSNYLLVFSKNWSHTKGSAIEIGALGMLLIAMIITTYAGKNFVKDAAPQLSIYIQVISPFPLIAFFIAVMRQERGAISKFLSHKVFVYLGEISFSLYLVHQIIIRWMFTKYDQEEILRNLIPSYCFYWISSLVVAATVFHSIEKPLRIPLKKLLGGRVDVPKTSFLP